MSTTTITDTILRPTGDPYPGVLVTVAAPEAEIFDLTGTSSWALVLDVPLTCLTDIGGKWSFALPWPSVSDPSSISWSITLLSMTLSGTIPDGVVGPVSLKTLKDSYGWVRS